MKRSTFSLVDVLLQADPALQQDRATMQFVIIALLLVAALLGLLTIWYWKQTNPRKNQSTIAGGRGTGRDDYYDDGFLEDDGYEQHAHQERSHNDRDARRPVVSQGPNNPRRSDAADPWTALTSADPDEPGPR